MQVVKKLYLDEGWTPTHGHFLIMGGFSFVKGGVETVLDYESFFEHLKIKTLYNFVDQPIFEPGGIAFPTITAEEIHDKARGDFLSKAIVILQSLWFIVQCIARAKQGLALTELELFTLALASLNGVMHYFWWDKPLGVKEPVKVYAKGERPAEKVVDGAGRLVSVVIGPEDLFIHFSPQERIKVSNLSLFQRLVGRPFQQMQCSLFQLHQRSWTVLSSSLSSMSRQRSVVSLSTINQFLHDRRETLHFPGDRYLWFLYLPIEWFFLNPCRALSACLFDIAATSTPKYHSTHVPTFYAPRIGSANHQLLVVLPFVACIFGALHCIAWNFHFPSHIEQLFWRIGSLAITVIPLVTFITIVFPGLLIDFLEARYDFRPSILFPRSVENILQAMKVVSITFLVGAGLVAYMLARLLLLTQAIMLLRKQPESAFYAIKWANFLPHI